MNSYIANGILLDVKQSIQGFCSCLCCGQRCSKICPATVTAILMPTTFILQMTGSFVDEWVCDYGMDNSTQLCLNMETDVTLCILETSSISFTCILLIIWLLVGCKTCCQNMGIDTLSVCCVCILPSLNVISGILNLGCCILAMRFYHEKNNWSYQFSFFAYAFTGISTLVVSLLSLCGYICIKTLNLRNAYYIQAGSDDADDETSRLVNDRNN